MKLTLPKNTFNSLTKKLLSLLVASIAITTSFAQAATDVIAPPQEFDPSGWNWLNILLCLLILLIVLVIAIGRRDHDGAYQIAIKRTK